MALDKLILPSLPPKWVEPSHLKLYGILQRGVTEVGKWSWMSFQAQNDAPTPLTQIFWTNLLLLGKCQYKWWIILNQKCIDPWYIYCSLQEYWGWLHYKGTGCDSWLYDKHKILFIRKCLSLAAKHSTDVENRSHVCCMSLLYTSTSLGISQKQDGLGSAVNQGLQLHEFTVLKWFKSHKCSPTRLLSSPQSFLLLRVIQKCSSY